ncbi:MAG: hypothetical protein Q8M37_11120 [Nevskia sp.]|nr:hypothetical protein [Nevskia sp.]
MKQQQLLSRKIGECFARRDDIENGIAYPGHALPGRQRRTNSGMNPLFVGLILDLHAPANFRARVERLLQQTLARNAGRQRVCGFSQQRRQPPLALGISVDQLLLHAGRQRCRQQNDAAAGRRMKAQQAFKHDLHVRIAGMNLVHHQHLADQAQQAQRLVAAVQHGQQCLVDGADAGTGQ